LNNSPGNRVQGHYAFSFERDMGCSDAEHAVSMSVGGGEVRIEWSPLPPRRIALITLPRLKVSFNATGVDAAAWQAFMRRFDLHTQRGGG
jgi:hypothetical protein